MTGTGTEFKSSKIHRNWNFLGRSLDFYPIVSNFISRSKKMMIELDCFQGCGVGKKFPCVGVASRKLVSVASVGKEILSTPKTPF